jgi:hypothetical protein
MAKMIDNTSATNLIQDPHTHGLLAVLFGAIIGAIRKVMRAGWTTWIQFTALVSVNVFFGVVAYLVALDYNLSGMKPIIVALVFGSLGEKSGEYAIKWAVEMLKIKTR